MDNDKLLDLCERTRRLDELYLAWDAARSELHSHPWHKDTEKRLRAAVDKKWRAYQRLVKGWTP